MMFLLTKVQVPPVTVRYFEVNVLLPAVSPLTKYVALICTVWFWGLPLPLLLSKRSDWASVAAVAPMANPMAQPSFTVLLDIKAVIVTRAFPVPEMLTVTAGPTVARSP